MGSVPQKRYSTERGGIGSVPPHGVRSTKALQSLGVWGVFHESPPPPLSTLQNVEVWGVFHKSATQQSVGVWGVFH